MRQMRGDREHPVVVLGRHGLDHACRPPATCAATARDRLADRCPRSASGCSGGRGTASRTPPRARNARCRRPDGRRRSARARADAAPRPGSAAALIEPTSVTIARAPSPAPWPRRPRRPPPAACRSRRDRRRRPPRRGTRRGAIGEARAPAPSRASPRVRAQATISPARPARAQDERERAVDQPDADQRDPLEARRRTARAHATNSPQRCDHGPVLVLETDRQPQAMRQAVGGHRARDDAVAARARRWPRRRSLRALGSNSTRTKLAMLGCDLRPSSAERPGEPGQPAVVVRARALLVVAVLERGDARRPAPACRR